MKPIKHTIPLFVLILSLFLHFDAEAQRRKKNKHNKKPKTGAVAVVKQSDVSEKDRVNAEYVFVEGMKHFIIDEYQSALDAFKESIKLNPNNAAVFYQTAYAYCKLENYEEGLRYAEKALQLEKGNPYYYKLLAQINQQFRNYEAAIEIYENLLANIEGQEAYYIDLASLYMQAEKPKSAIAAFTKAEEVYGINESIIRQKQKLYLNLNNFDAALKEGNRLIEAFPGESYFLIAQARLLMLNNRVDEAAKMLEAKKESFSQDGDFSLLLADISRRQGSRTGYEENLMAAFKSEALDLSSKIKAISDYLNYSTDEKAQLMALDVGKILVAQYPDDENSNALYGDLLMAAQNTEKARKYYVKSASINGDNFNLWDKIIRIDSELNDIESVIKHSEKALEYFPNQPIFWFYNGTGKLINKEYDDAIEALEYGKTISKDDMTSSQFDAQMGDAYHELKEYDKSDAAYDAVLTKDANNVHVLNNYSYYLSLRKSKLDKAKKMAKKLVELEPENATFLDTYGWVLFVAGDYEEAKPMLKKAYENAKDNATITEHYGDVLFKLGQKDEALNLWKEADGLGGENPEKLKNKIEKETFID